MKVSAHFICYQVFIPPALALRAGSSTRDWMADQAFNLNPALGGAPVGGAGMSWPGMTTRLAPASQEEQRGPPWVSGVVLKQACVRGLSQRQLSAQLPVSNSRPGVHGW
jgi:hypothetical protein